MSIEAHMHLLETKNLESETWEKLSRVKMLFLLIQIGVEKSSPESAQIICNEVQRLQYHYKPKERCLP